MARSFIYSLKPRLSIPVCGFHSSPSRSTAALIDGKSAARSILEDLKGKVNRWMESGRRPPCLTAIIVGHNPASHSYVNIKRRAAQRIGIDVNILKLPSSTSENRLLQEIMRLNEDPFVDGILVQLPLPGHITERTICNSVAPLKDVDGFNQINIGKLCLNLRGLAPCTALSVSHLIKTTGIPTSGKHAVICGRSKNVGLPIAMLLHSQSGGLAGGMDMTTTVCHRFTPPEQLSSLLASADVIVSAAGVPNLIRGNMLKKGACVIDVGFSRVYDRELNTARIVGDVCFEEALEVAGHITPVPGGVGPVTVAMLMRNTFFAAKSMTSYQLDRYSGLAFI